MIFHGSGGEVRIQRARLGTVAQQQNPLLHTFVSSRRTFMTAGDQQQNGSQHGSAHKNSRKSHTGQ